MAKKTKILAEELEYVCAQRNLTLARRVFAQLKKKVDVTDAELATGQMRLDKAKEKADAANAVMVRAGLSKGSI